MDLGSAPARKASVKNDRKVIAVNAAGLHQLAAMFTGVPALVLSDKEATEFADKLADVLDHMGYNITGGEVGLVGKVVALGLCVYVIEAPRVPLLLSAAKARKAQGARPTAPATPAEAFTPPPSKGGYDLSGLN